MDTSDVKHFCSIREEPGFSLLWGRHFALIEQYEIRFEELKKTGMNDHQVRAELMADHVAQSRGR